MCNERDAALIVTSAGAARRVDQCMRALVQLLNDVGIQTFDSCCGHGERWGHITIKAEDAQRARALGVRVCEDAGGGVECYPFVGRLDGTVNIILPAIPDSGVARLPSSTRKSSRRNRRSLRKR